jgi:mono/diheme cytochrome c family protein
MSRLNTRTIARMNHRLDSHRHGSLDRIIRVAALLALCITGGHLVPVHAQTGAAAPAAANAVARGRYLADAGNCASCHTREGGAALEGGVAFETDFGTIYSTNITPDRGAGIGAWTEAQFIRAMREGLDAEGNHLYPVFPYTSFNKVSNADLTAILAYLKSVPPSKYAPPANALRFPYNQRALMAAWKALFFEPAPFAPQRNQSAEWNRGAYLVEGLGHCGTCHTPRNFLGAEDNDEALSGGVYRDKIPGGEIRRWTAVNITQAASGLKAWSVKDIADYLKTGHGGRAGSFGPMNEVVTNSMMRLTDGDIRAMAVYLKSVPPRESSSKQTLSAERLNAGETLYTIHCGTCHLPTGLGSTPGSELGPPLVGSAVVQAADPATLINVILYESKTVVPAPQRAWNDMKGFGDLLDDDEVATLANYLRASWGNLGGEVTAEDVAKQR